MLIHRQQIVFVCYSVLNHQIVHLLILQLQIVYLYVLHSRVCMGRLLVSPVLLPVLAIHMLIHMQDYV
jgi:hypothetical protein